MNLTLTLLFRVLTGRLPAWTLVNYVLICTRIHPAFPYVDAGLHAIVGGIAFTLFYQLHSSSGVEHVRDMREHAVESADESLMQSARGVEEELARAADLYQDCTTLRQRLDVSMRYAKIESMIRRSFTKPERILAFFEC